MCHIHLGSIHAMRLSKVSSFSQEPRFSYRRCAMTQAKSPPPDALLPDWDAKAREIANDVHGRSYGWLVTNIATALRTAHAAGLSERDAGWQPIESAPRDGRVIWYY